MSDYTSPYVFEVEKARFLQMARALESASNAKEFRSRLLAVTTAPWHSYDLLALVSRVAECGGGLSDLMSVDLDGDGVPQP